MPARPLSREWTRAGSASGLKSLPCAVLPWKPFSSFFNAFPPFFYYCGKTHTSFSILTLCRPAALCPLALLCSRPASPEGLHPADLKLCPPATSSPCFSPGLWPRHPPFYSRDLMQAEPHSTGPSVTGFCHSAWWMPGLPSRLGLRTVRVCADHVLCVSWSVGG